MKQLFLVLLLLCTVSVSAQDVIVKKDGSTIVCRVVELTESEIVYKKWGNLNGSSYVMERSAASAINYQNGKKVNLSEATNLYKPSNQNDGVQNFNDRVLLRLDQDNNRIPQTIKKLRLIGLIGGGALVATGGIIFLHISSSRIASDFEYIAAGVTTGLGAIGATVCLLKARSMTKQYEGLQASSLYQHDFKFNNGSSLSAGVDMITDQNIGSNTLGLGLHYNF